MVSVSERPEGCEQDGKREESSHGKWEKWTRRANKSISKAKNYSTCSNKDVERWPGHRWKPRGYHVTLDTGGNTCCHWCKSPKCYSSPPPALPPDMRA